MIIDNLNGLRHVRNERGHERIGAMLTSQPQSTLHTHMIEAYSPPSRKRRQSATLSNTDTAVKKVKYGDSSSFPPAFWDQLSKIDLTKGAVKELNRRNKISRLQVPSEKIQRPIIRKHLARQRGASQSSYEAIGYLLQTRASHLRRFARHGGPDLSDLRGVCYLRRIASPADGLQFPEPKETAMSSDISSSRTPHRSRSLSSLKHSTTTSASKSTTPYNRNFQQNLIDSCVYPPAYRHTDGQIPAKPGNWEEINERLARRRPSLSPSRFTKDDYDRFVQADADAAKEKQVMTTVIPLIEGDVGDARCVSGGIPFNNLDHLTDGTLVPGNPDIFYGARPEDLNKAIRQELSNLIIPSTQDSLPLLPNFFLAVKGPDGTLAVATKQASYDGALGARGMQALLSFGQSDPAQSTDAHTLTSIYQGGQLTMYTSHVVKGSDSVEKPRFYMHQIRGWSMKGDYEQFLLGATHYRNGIAWAKEQRSQAICRANQAVVSTTIESDIQGTTELVNTVSEGSKVTRSTTKDSSATSSDGPKPEGLVKTQTSKRVSTRSIDTRKARRKRF